jgi:small-conductance mechanosensitive channel
LLHLWTYNAHYWDVYFDLMENIKLALDENHIQMPSPQMDVHVNDLPQSHALPDTYSDRGMTQSENHVGMKSHS